MNYIPLCPHCASADIGCESTSSWDPPTQEWVHESAYDNMFCRTCEREFETACWTPIEEGETP